MVYSPVLLPGELYLLAEVYLLQFAVVRLEFPIDWFLLVLVVPVEYPFAMAVLGLQVV